jgi:hypothetical protein
MPALAEYAAAIEVTGKLDAGELLVGLATLALAIFTWRLAKTTKTSVEQATLSAEAARDSADAERATVEAMQMPYVIAVPIPYDDLITHHGDDYREVTRPEVPREIHVMGTPVEGLWIRLRLENIGAGPAITDGLSLVLDGRGDVLDDDETQVPIRAGSWRDTDVSLGQTEPPDEDGRLVINYRSADGTRYETASRILSGDRKLYCLTFERGRNPN